MTTHQQIVVTAHGGLEVMQLRDVDLPEPATGEVRIRILAAGVSAYDTMVRRARWLPGGNKVPYVPGLDVVGTIDAVGRGASNFRQGQMVAASTIYLGGGGYAEHVCLPTTEMVPVPAGVDPAQAVCLVTNYLTAHCALHRTAQITPGETMLVHGAAGGVGSALVELGRLAGAEIYGTASKPNHEAVAGLGATPIDYRSRNFLTEIRKLTNDGVDVVFDPIGGARQLVRSYRALRPSGRLIWFGVAASATRGLRVIPASLTTALALKIFPGNKQVPFMEDMGKIGQSHGDWFRDTLTELLDLLAQGAISPIVSECIPLHEAARAHAVVDHGGHVGKVVLVPAHDSTPPPENEPAGEQPQGRSALVDQ